MSAIIFDFDGTLVDTEPLHERAVREALVAHGVPVEEGMTIGLADEDAIGQAFARVGRRIDAGLLGELCLRKTEIYEVLMESATITVYPGAVELVRGGAEVCPVGICTAAVLREVRPVVRKLGLTDVVRTIVTADEVERKKPHPDGYRLAAERLGVDATRCIAIEDSVRGVESAKRAGCFVVGVLHTTDRERLGQADVLIERIGLLSAGELLEMAERRRG